MKKNIKHMWMIILAISLPLYFLGCSKSQNDSLDKKSESTHEEADHGKNDEHNEHDGHDNHEGHDDHKKHDNHKGHDEHDDHKGH